MLRSSCWCDVDVGIVVFVVVLVVIVVVTTAVVVTTTVVVNIFGDKMHKLQLNFSFYRNKRGRNWSNKVYYFFFIE